MTLLALLPAAILAQDQWTTVTVYDVLQEDCRANTSNKDFGDPAGDAYFQLKDMYLPYACAACKTTKEGCRSSATFDCNNPESSGNLVVRKVEIEVKLPYGTYSLCNVRPGGCDYECETEDRQPTTGVGKKAVCSGGSGYPGGFVCYDGKCFPSSHSKENQTECESSCKPGAEKYACFDKKCFPTHHGTQNKTECESSCGKLTSPPFPLHVQEPQAGISCSMAGSTPSEERDSHKWDYWNYNSAGTLGEYVTPPSADSPRRVTGNGTWYSFAANVEGTAWRNAKILKVINAECHANALNQLIHKTGKECFDACPPGSNATDECYVSCIFDTTLGKDSGSSITLEGGILPSDITGAWLKGFESDDLGAGGCPPCPATGACPPPSQLDWQSAGVERTAVLRMPQRRPAPRRHSPTP